MTTGSTSSASRVHATEGAEVRHPPSPETGGASTADVEALSAVDALAQLSFLVQATLERRAAEHDVSIVVTRLMGILRDRTPTMNELAALLELDKSSVSGLVDRAVRRGFVQRMPSATDRRSVRVALTDEGRRMAVDVTSEFGSDIERLLAPLSERDGKSLTRIATAVLARHVSERGSAADGADEFA
ncbi:MarR family winged helix-turn-helix transcriptional regulator [Humibacter ginsenosidimutans]|uniref:MarR family transcriptional regulator n=1 Tax=Humibacter ginsenosidimutans TaxID=2599293 RepID=A0A5B8M4J6_9MICO|nr:MarR family transcriptional regulator [Humibacter ginsenosidimutans]QDZ14715.1 MarR family transcriptional regulator [Humibacter ginsenosidimutans]